jgi:uncharacterized protein YecE (DUF72 family)
MSFFIGCPIWSFKGWVGSFYPKGTKPSEYLREYARRLTAIEGNTTFYAVPAGRTIEQWVSETPETFRFCPKIPKGISHTGRLTDHLEQARGFVEVMSQLGTRLGPIFLQLPPSYSPRQFKDLKSFLEAWPLKIRLAVEVRHLDWFDAPHHASLTQFLVDHNMARVLIDTRPIRSLDGDRILSGSVYQTLLEARKRKPNVPLLLDRTTDFVFLRYIGHPQMDINAPVLDEWESYLASQLHEDADAFVFCHSPDNLTAPYICRELHQRLSKQISIDPLPWGEADKHGFEQSRLL